MLQRKFTVRCSVIGSLCMFVSLFITLCALYHNQSSISSLSPLCGSLFQTFSFPLAELHSRLNCQLLAITMFIHRFHSFHQQLIRIQSIFFSSFFTSFMAMGSVVQKILFPLLFAYRSLFISCFEYFHSIHRLLVPNMPLATLE